MYHDVQPMIVINIRNAQTLSNLHVSLRTYVAGRRNRVRIPPEWEEEVERLQQVALQQRQFPFTLQVDDELTHLYTSAIDRSFIGAGGPRYVGREADDMNRVYDEITGHYSGNYKAWLRRG